ncbi:MAG TPA: PorT family protein, partial [Flavobacterium sp.]
MRIFFFAVLFIAFNAFSQDKEAPDFEAVDSLYREDQFYFGITYNILQQRPESLDQNKFSLGLSLGFLRDMPINKSRTAAIAVGFGYSLNNFNQNLFITDVEGNTEYHI